MTIVDVSEVKEEFIAFTFMVRSDVGCMNLLRKFENTSHVYTAFKIIVIST